MWQMMKGITKFDNKNHKMFLCFVFKGKISGVCTMWFKMPSMDLWINCCKVTKSTWEMIMVLSGWR